jgi:hypothetical protein
MESYKLDKIILDILNIKDCFYTNHTLGNEIYKKWKGLKKNTIILTDNLKNILNYDSDIQVVQLYDFIERIKLKNYIYTINNPPNCIFYSYNQKPIY